VKIKILPAKNTLELTDACASQTREIVLNGHTIESISRILVEKLLTSGPIRKKMRAPF
jgi:hypothetical protein